MDSHRDAVAGIASRIRQFHCRQEPFRIYHGSTNSTRQSQHRRDRVVDTSKLSHVLKVDIQKRSVLVEPNVPMDRLVEATLPYGLVPPVVMEFPGITVGGGFAGTSGESSSFRYGFFDRTVLWIEIVLANGDVVTASHTDKPDLFYGAAASFGTLGVTTLLELQLIEAKGYVELTYHPISSISQAIQKTEQMTMDPSVDYLDGIFFARDHGVICTGRLTNTVQEGVNVQGFTRPHDPWFYLHAKKVVKRNPTECPTTEAVPLVDYLFRYDRGGFWVGVYAFRYFMTPFNRITRWILDAFLHTRVMYRALHQSGHSKRYIIQDLAVPYSAAEEFINFLDRTFGFYPIWLCPLRQRGQSTHSPHGLQAEKAGADEEATPEMLLNFGVWGPGPTQGDEFVKLNRVLERKVQELHGKKWLYAQAYYTEEEFWDIYPRQEHDALREQYHATYLPSLYDKVKVNVKREQNANAKSWSTWFREIVWNVWPVSGFYGVYKAAIGGDYLLLKEDREMSKLKVG